MALIDIFKSLFRSVESSGKKTEKSIENDTDSNSIAVTATVMSDEDEVSYMLENRTDPALFEWKENPHLYQPRFERPQEEICPYCSATLKDRAQSSRRSQFHCKSCNNLVFADPKQNIFPSRYLDRRQALIAKYLAKLDKDLCSAGRTEDFWWTAQQIEWTKNKKTLKTSEAADVIWSLMNYSVLHLQEILPKEYEHAISQCIAEQQAMLEEYKDEEKEALRYLKDIRKTGVKREEKKVRLVCPYCEYDLGPTKKPERRSTRKCKNCNKKIIVNPKQDLYATPFLTERQKYLVEVVDQLSAWVFTEVSKEQIEKLRSKSKSDHDVGRADLAPDIRELISLNIDTAKAYDKKEKIRYQRIKNANKDLLELEDKLRERGATIDSVFPDREFVSYKHVENLLAEFDEKLGLEAK